VKGLKPEGMREIPYIFREERRGCGCKGGDDAGEWFAGKIGRVWHGKVSTVFRRKSQYKAGRRVWAAIHRTFGNLVWVRATAYWIA
jgi:hypothetical protein